MQKKSKNLNLHIGNQTAVAAGSMLEPFEFALAHGFSAFEFFPDRGLSGCAGWDEREVIPELRRHIREQARSANLILTVHASLEIDPLRDCQDSRLDSTVAFAADIGATLVNLHLDASQGAERFVQALLPWMAMTAKAGLQLALENTVFTGPDDFNEFFRVLRRHGRKPFHHVGMTFDLGHANLHQPFRNDYWSYLDSLSPEVPLLHLHLHENYGDRDSHLPLFTGPSRDNPAGLAGLVERLRQRRFSGCAILEQWPQPPSLLVSARDQLIALVEKHRGET